MASDAVSSMSKRMQTPNISGGPQKPDPMVQPALANAMRLGKTLSALAPAGTRMGVNGPGSAQPMQTPQPFSAGRVGGQRGSVQAPF